MNHGRRMEMSTHAPKSHQPMLRYVSMRFGS